MRDMAHECRVVNWNMTVWYSPLISLKMKAETKHLVVSDNQILSRCFLLQVSWCRTFYIVTRLLTEEPRIRGFIPGISKRFFSPKESVLTLGHTSLPRSVYRWLFPWV